MICPTLDMTADDLSATALSPPGHPFLKELIELETKAPYRKYALLPDAVGRILKPAEGADTADTHDHEASKRPEHEVADIFNLYGVEYRAAHKLTVEQLQVMYAISHCRTAAYGFHTDICDKCGHTESAYCSCRDRHCPKCQGVAKRKWVNARIDELLPVAYHHVIFTLPNQLSELSQFNRTLMYDLLFESASQTLLTFGYDPKHLGAQIGFYGILHTWSQTLWPHAHLHFIVTAGGLTDDGRWVEPKYKKKFLFPVKALSKVFRGKFIQGLKKAYHAGALILTDDLNIRSDNDFERWIDRLVARDWVVHSKPPFAGPEAVVRYIGRYTHRAAISCNRIISIEGGLIRFSYKDNKEKDKNKIWKEMTLPADEFITRFLYHVLPKRYHRIRHYGFLNNCQKHNNLEKIRQFLVSSETFEVPAVAITPENTDGILCPKCEKGHLRSFLVTDGYGQVLKCDISVFSECGGKAYDDTS